MNKFYFTHLAFVLLLLSGVNVFGQENTSQVNAAAPTNNHGITIVERGNIQINEFRVGGRLEEVIVKRKNGFDEYYHNRLGDTQWSPTESDLGEIQNMRHWKISEW